MQYVLLYDGAALIMTVSYEALSTMTQVHFCRHLLAGLGYHQYADKHSCTVCVLP